MYTIEYMQKADKKRKTSPLLMQCVLFACDELNATQRKACRVSDSNPQADLTKYARELMDEVLVSRKK